MKLSLADQSFRLTPGRAYRWQVILLCNSNRPSTAQIVEATLQVVEPTVQLQAVLAQSRNRSQRTAAYAGSDLWYDALAELQSDPALKADMASLLKDLAELETPTRREQLQQAIAVLK